MTTFREAKAAMAGRKANEEILIAWWDREWFEDMLGTKITDDEWDNVRDYCEKAMEYGGWGDDLTSAALDALNETRDSDEVTA